MPSTFKPLLNGSGSQVPAASNPNAHRELKSHFKPLVISGDNTPAAVVSAAPSSHVHAGGAMSTSHLGLPEPAPRPSSAVTQLIRDGDRITHIEIRCGCGEIITLECAYNVPG